MLLGKINDLYDSLFTPVRTTLITGKGVSASTGAYTDNASQNAVSVDLTGLNAELLRFVWVVSSQFGYGFFVNGVWQGKRISSFPSGAYYEKTTIQVPTGATEFRMSWSTSLYTGDNTVYAFLTDAMKQAIVGVEHSNSLYKSETIESANLKTNGGLLKDGTFNENETYGHIEIPLDDNISYKNFTFKRTYVNPSTYNCYGFIVNGTFVGYAGYASASETPSNITVEVPLGATSFRVCWNRNQVADGAFSLSTDATRRGTHGLKNNPVFQFTPDFVLSRVPTYTCPTSAQAAALKPADLYAMYDALMASYPDYISKVDCDAIAQAALGITAPAEMSGLPIYMYKFSPKIGDDGSGLDHTSRIKLFVTSMHPQEKLGLYTTFYTAKMLCENWMNDVNAEQLRSLVDIYIMPCPWAWNMLTGSRTNYNGVNGNRQFPTRNWKVSGSGTTDYTGTEPLSEYEAKVINYFLLDIAPDVCLDVHTSGHDNVGHMGIVLVNKNDQPLIDLCGVIARTTSNRAIQDNSNFPSSPDTCLYGVYPEDGSAKGEFYEYAYEQGCKYSILSEESPYSKWDEGVFNGSGPDIDSYTDGILKEQIQWIFNTLLRLTRQACVRYYTD